MNFCALFLFAMFLNGKKHAFLGVHGHFYHVNIFFFTFSLPWDLHVIFSSLLYFRKCG